MVLLFSIYAVIEDQEVFKILFLMVSFLKKYHFGVLFSAVIVFIFSLLVVDLFVCVNEIIVHWYWKLSSVELQIVCGLYPNRTFGFSSPAGLWKVMDRVLVGCSDLLASIYCFAWSKIYFKIFVHTLFCWFLTIFIEFTGSSFIDPETCPRGRYKIVCGPYPNWTYSFYSPVGLWKVMSRVLVVWLNLSSSIDCLDSSKSYHVIPEDCCLN